jgi:spermidine synthase
LTEPTLPFVFTASGIKALYFKLDQLQSRMSSARPDHLDVDYTRTMMGFLLFNRSPARIAIIGLGGGSLAKFCYRHLPQAIITVVEINPHVIALRDEFLIPTDDGRFNVVLADGAEFVQHTPPGMAPGMDVLMVDGFDAEGQAATLCSQPFYDHCHQALADQGIMVVNLHHDHPEFDVYMARIQRSFEGNVIAIASREKSNTIVFARKGLRISAQALRDDDCLEHFGPEVRSQLRPEFSRITWLVVEPRG